MTERKLEYSGISVVGRRPGGGGGTEEPRPHQEQKEICWDKSASITLPSSHLVYSPPFPLRPVRQPHSRPQRWGVEGPRQPGSPHRRSLA